ncbi:MAG: hypothetical protein ACT4PL_10610 [Phycisphaerales bacterium]
MSLRASPVLSGFRTSSTTMERDSCIGGSRRWNLFITAALCAVFITSIVGAGYGRYLEKQAAIEAVEAGTRLERDPGTPTPARRPRLIQSPHLYEDIPSESVLVSA